MAFPPPPGSSKLDEDEVSLIFSTTLLPIHREDPNILRFISAYLRCRDPRQAALEAGLTPQSGVNLRNRPDIYSAILKITQKSAMKYGFDAHEVIERVKEVSAIDPIEFENEDGSFKTSLRQIAPESRRAIKKFKAKNIYGTDPNGMKIVIGQLLEVELYDKLRAVELMGRETDLFKETKKVEHDVGKNMASILLESSRRADERVRELAMNAREVKEIQGGSGHDEGSGDT